MNIDYNRNFPISPCKFFCIYLQAGTDARLRTQINADFVRRSKTKRSRLSVFICVQKLVICRLVKKLLITSLNITMNQKISGQAREQYQMLLDPA